MQMLDYELIKKMNSKNISINKEITKERLKEIWSKITREELKRTIKLGGFSNSRSFNKTRKTGIISVRMTVALAVALKINPFFLSAEEDDKEKYSEEMLIRFLKDKKIPYKFEICMEEKYREELLEEIKMIMNTTENKSFKKIEDLNKEEILTLIDSLFIKEKLEKTKNKIMLIKLILSNS
ncbi:hypothetical protein [uncultured Clostridium sp.]|uniref:hypothetical protein n=1 Tax=uncultured Clostridium sp. TaxID=59620 RepID=UPI00260D85BC|nr:hypothetical protein [uncultured Clostridium sp.]